VDLTIKMAEEQPENINIQPGLNNEIKTPIWLSVSEAAKIGGVQTKTIRRAIQYNKVKYKIIGNRYLIDLATLITFLFAKTKLKNKLNQFGLGQYVDKWK
jgi:excisionase family DNA binding protein